MATNKDATVALNVDCQVTDETIVQLKRQNDELRARLDQEVNAGHRLDRDLRTLEADFMHFDREEKSVSMMVKDSADVGHANADLNAHLSELKVQNARVLAENRRLQQELEAQL